MPKEIDDENDGATPYEDELNAWVLKLEKRVDPLLSPGMRSGGHTISPDFLVKLLLQNEQNNPQTGKCWLDENPKPVFSRGK